MNKSFNGKPQASVRFDAAEDWREIGRAAMTVITPFEWPWMKKKLSRLQLAVKR